MMKKLLVVLAVLVISTAANAGFILSPSPEAPEGNVAITVSAADISQATYLALAVEGDGTLTNFAAGANAPADTALLGTLSDMGVTDLGQGEIWTIAHFATSPVYNDGIYLTATLSGGVNGDVVTLYETDGMSFTSLGSFTVVPEPITVALLGLGGLFIRRRK